MTSKVLIVWASLMASDFLAASFLIAGEKDPTVHKIAILHTNDMHGHLTPWQGWEGELKGKTIGGLGQAASGRCRNRNNDMKTGAFKHDPNPDRLRSSRRCRGRIGRCGHPEWK